MIIVKKKSKKIKFDTQLVTGWILFTNQEYQIIQDNIQQHATKTQEILSRFFCNNYSVLEIVWQKDTSFIAVEDGQISCVKHADTLKETLS